MQSSNHITKVGANIKFQFAQHKINDFSAEIDRLRSALTLATILAFRSSAKSDHNEVLTRLVELAKGSTADDEALKNNIRLLVDIKSQTGEKLDVLDNRMQQCLARIDDIRKASPQTRENQILSWLTFRQMAWRFEEVSNAHQKTYSWILEKPAEDDGWDDFKAHLTQNVAKPYFINGKAGSGKSTLMTYIVGHRQTKQILAQWARNDNKALLVARFFFWNLGTPLQKTTTGLLRSLLWNILTEHPELIPAIFPNLYQICDADVGDPTYIEVKTAWIRLLDKSKDFLKLAIFIDGLDEFDGDHSDLAEFVTDLCSSNVKVVVSSRPINASLHAFCGCPSLKLQDLTRKDVEIYVNDNLASHKLMVPFTRYCPEISRAIVVEIKRKAKGVFLWVKLVVRLLIDGLQGGDSIEDLQRKLQSLPGDLRALYRRMISQIPVDHQEQAVEIFQLFQKWRIFTGEAFPALLLHYALRPPGENLERGIHPLSAETIAWHCQQITARVQSRCCGLLEVTDTYVLDEIQAHQDRIVGHVGSDLCLDARSKKDLSDILHCKLEYLHCTVAEFLQSDDVKLELQDRSCQTFEPYQRLAAACLALAKLSGVRFWQTITMTYVAFVFKLYKHAPSDIRVRLVGYIAALDDATTSCHMMVQEQDQVFTQTQHHWTATRVAQEMLLGCYGSYGTNRWNGTLLAEGLPRPASILTLAARLGFTQYLQAKSAHYDFKPLLLLSFALDSWIEDDSEPPALSDRRDTLLFLLNEMRKFKAEDDVDDIRSFSLEFAEGYTSNKETDLSVFVACFIVTKTSPESWSDTYPTTRLRDMSRTLQRDHDSENQQLGLRLSQAVYERLHGSRVCSMCRTSCHMLKTCPKLSVKEPRHDTVKSGKVQKRRRQKKK
jgi:hypothetical protein